MKNKFKKQSGFTLIEMLIAVSLFVIVVTISIGAILSVFDANRKSQASKTVVDNLNLSIENMTRTIRFGGNYHCGSGGTLSSPQNCTDNTNGDTFLAVTFYDKNLARNVIVAYRLNGNAIEMSYDGGSFIPITATEANIQILKFRVFGSATSDNVQPYVVAVIRGYAGSKPTTQSVFSIETLMSQRTLDFH
jgi:prepilin-type N-terminal cleavage/methylation domain-containing protein